MILLIAIGVVAVVASAATLVTALHDGYRRVPARPSP